ncbi:MAG: AAA family ATPase [Betaproteobacteria bacterium]
MHDAITQFRDAIQSCGLVPPDSIEADGKLHRFASNGKRGDDSGYYGLYGDGVPAGFFGDWRTGIYETWRADIGRTLTRTEEVAHRAKVLAMQQEREAAKSIEQADAATKAAEIMRTAVPAPDDHAYLVAKGISANGARIYDGTLLIPMRVGLELHSLQFISADGDKRFLTGGRVAGCYFSIGRLDNAAALCIAEGFATGATIHQAAGYPVAVAFTAGNLGAVAEGMRQRFPKVRLILCADDDAATAGNPGLTKATAAARAVNGLLAVPRFGIDRRADQSDFNDMWLESGTDAVKRAIVDARVPAGDHTPFGAQSTLPPAYTRTVSLVRASEVKTVPIAWLWNGYLAAGKMHVLGGVPGTGKTTIAMFVAATVSTGGRWPDGSLCTVGNVVIWSGEDDPADTLIPRLLLAGADLSRVYFITAVLAGQQLRSFDPATDMEPLQRKIAEIGDVRLLIVDPIVSAIAGDSHKNAEVRRGLQPLADLATAISCAVLGITHFSKGTGGRDPVERLTGSVAFGALARVVWVSAKHQREVEDGRIMRILIRAKSNIGQDDGGFEYEVQQAELKSHPGVFASYVLWGAALEGSARELLVRADAVDDAPAGDALAEAVQFLSELLTDGAAPVNIIKAEANSAGHSWTTIRRAKNELGIKPRKSSMPGGWEWALPRRCSKNPEDAQQQTVSAFGDDEHLRDEPNGAEVEI